MSERILITGANRGIGLEFVRQYRDAGCEVIATARKPVAAEELRLLNVEVLKLDVSSAGSVAGFTQDLSERPLDLVINNAGMYGPRDGQSIDKIDFVKWEEVLAVNTLGPMRVAMAVQPSLLAGEGRKLVSVTSKMGSTANHGGGHYAYRSSKAALNNVMVGLAKDWRNDGMTVAVLHPGWVQTDMGGPSADLSPEQSVEGMRSVIEGLTPDDSGSFFNYDGETIDW